MRRVRPGPGQESVWDYPRPPRVEPEPRPVRIEHDGTAIAASDRALRVLETSHPPGIYLPPDAFADGLLIPNRRRTVCEWKGVAVYWDLGVDGGRIAAVGWSYPDPNRGYEQITDYVSIYPGRVDACYLGGERVEPQPGGFYGGWITREIVGPLKGGPGTWGW